jgi:REP element-mobilizing transposase RayT
MIRGIEKSPIVKDDKDRADFVSRLGTPAKKTGTTVYAWALMTNHAHMLLRSGNSAPARRINIGGSTHAGTE